MNALVEAGQEAVDKASTVEAVEAAEKACNDAVADKNLAIAKAAIAATKVADGTTVDTSTFTLANATYTVDKTTVYGDVTEYELIITSTLGTAKTAKVTVTVNN